MATWVVYIRQSSKGTNRSLNEFNFTVKADSKEDAEAAALKELDHYSHLQTNHVQDNPLANALLRPYRKLTWQGARNVIVAIRRVHE
jgi:hypothetical protein